MIKSIETKQGIVLIREANLADIEQYRALRLFALQESPTAFGQDYETSLSYPPEYWQERLCEDEHSAMFVAEKGGQLCHLVAVFGHHLEDRFQIPVHVVRSKHTDFHNGLLSCVIARNSRSG